MNKINKKFFLFFIFFIFFPIKAFAWPSANEWVPFYKNGTIVQDSISDTNGTRNIVSDSTHAAGFIFNDGTYLYFRLRLDDDPTGSGGQGFLKPYGWGIEFDTNKNSNDYEWIMILNGIDKTESIMFQQNTVTGTLNDPSDKAEVIYSQNTLSSSNYRIVLADTSINGSQDYFIEWLFSYSSFKQATGLTDTSPIRAFLGSSPSTNNLTENGGDLVGTDLVSGFSDYLTPYGKKPTTGEVMFVSDLSGNGDVTKYCRGDIIYIRVKDLDQNTNSTTKQSVKVKLTAPSGDSETINLNETNIDNGIFTGSISTALGTVKSSDGILEISLGDIITVTYTDTIDENNNENQNRTDTVKTEPNISVQKSVSPSSVTSSATVHYTITIKESSGCDNGKISLIKDVLPDGFSYVLGSTSGITTNNPQITGQNLSWSGQWTVAAGGQVVLSFDATASQVSGTHYNIAIINGDNFTSVSTGSTAPVKVIAPLIELIKSTDKENSKPGEEVIYSIHYHNIGDAASYTIIICDTIPSFTTYITSSMKAGASNSTYETVDNISLTDTPDDDQGNINSKIEGDNITFTIKTLNPNDAKDNSGNDEGKLYFKIRIN
ncbi:MAG: DUF11 domain-containing protein [Desulfobacterales bacterium]|nr:DUF11 domain-containing protein [Desulfobacterales bacterium]